MGDIGEKVLSPALELLRGSGALLEGHFLLSSGRHSDKYVQCARLLQYPEKAAAALAPVAEQVRASVAAGGLAVDVLAGPAMGGILVAYELGRQLGLPAFFTERGDDGIMSLRRGFEIKPGSRILITEDVITTGKSFGECAAVLEARGGIISALACVVDRRTPGVEVPWPLYAACRVDAKNQAPEDCELCRQGLPLVKPGSRRIGR
ncbi:MAG: orotate phosphoribosyltransferase [Spirochaetaceae bacterium]|jgi:orotate phosphoribosyltransferase|nr:orotate phosphoribosyltransferase [Spirochaetaceae bacterium]